MDFDVTQIVSALKKEGPKMLAVLLIVAILKIVVYYSIGRTHGGKFEFLFPDLKEWAIIIIASIVINFASSYIIKHLFTSGMSLVDSDVKNMGATAASYAF